MVADSMADGMYEYLGVKVELRRIGDGQHCREKVTLYRCPSPPPLYHPIDTQIHGRVARCTSYVVRVARYTTW